MKRAAGTVRRLMDTDRAAGNGEVEFARLEFGAAGIGLVKGGPFDLEFDRDPVIILPLDPPLAGADLVGVKARPDCQGVGMHIIPAVFTNLADGAQITTRIGVL